MQDCDGFTCEKEEMRAISLLSALHNESKSTVVFLKHRCCFYFCNLRENKFPQSKLFRDYSVTV